MNLNPGGKQARLRDSIIPEDDPFIPQHLRGLPQMFCYDQAHPNPQLAGQPKGVQAILEERGLWQHYTTQAHEAGKPPLKFRCSTCVTSNLQKDAENRAAKLVQQAQDSGYYLTQEQCVGNLLDANGSCSAINLGINTSKNPHAASCCWSKILSQQSDFLNKQPLLQAIIKEAAHVCLFLPKFHCQLNPIEIFWSYIKECESYINMYLLSKNWTDTHYFFFQRTESNPTHVNHLLLARLSLRK